MHIRTTCPRTTWRSVVALAVALATMLVAILATAPAADAQPQNRDRVSITSAADGSTVGTSTLWRHRRGISARLRTRGLERGDAYTVWAVVFNEPDGCEGPCDAADLANPAAEAVSTLLTGKVAQDRWTVFRGRLPVGDALTDPRGAEIHLVVRTHGPVIRGLRHEQLTTLNGGCPPNTCANVQMAVHA